MVAADILKIRRTVWWQLVRTLRSRGRGIRESGAFLLGARTPHTGTVTAFVCYDDMDPQALDTGIVIIRSVGFRNLWTICRASGLEVLADAHTHGNATPRQSSTDRENPVISEAGHVALILPSFAQISPLALGETAVYEYLGDYDWRCWTQRERDKRVRLCLY